MKLRINGPTTMYAAIFGLILAVVALRAWELNDDIHGILMALLAKIFSFFHKSDDAEIPSFRADSIFSITEVRLIFVLRFIAVSLSFFAILSALWARKRNIFSAYYASAVLIGFGACLLVHKAVALAFAALVILSIAIINVVNKSRYNSSLKTDAEQRRST